MILPALKDASTDRRVRGAPLAVLTYLHGVLELGLYRPVKHWVVADRLGLKRNTVSGALKLLVQLGYLVEGARRERNVGTYMLVSAQPESDEIRSA